VGFRYQLRLSEGDDVGECEWGYHPQAGDDIRADGNVRYRVRSVIPVAESQAS
jgi:hypothetical protein